MLFGRLAPVVGNAGEPSDDYFKNVSLLLQGNGTDGAQNNTFVDGSPNNFSITRNGNTTQGTFSPYGDNWSTYFTGSSYITAPASSEYDISGVNFTIEFWFNWTKGNTMTYSGIQVATTFHTGVGWAINCDSLGTDNLTAMAFACYDGGWTSASNSSINSTTMPIGTWHHIAIVRNGTGSGNLKFFLDGVNVGGTFNAPTYTGSGGQLCFGVYQQNLVYAGNPNMYISNFRLVKGTALYTSNFTPPTRTLTAVTNTKFLGHQSNRFIDNSSYAATLTLNGTSSVQRFSPFSPTLSYSETTIGGSGYFDGDGDYLSLPSNAAFNTLSGTTFTLEFWMYPTAYASGSGFYEERDIFSTSDVYPNGFRVGLNTSSVLWYDYVGSTRISYAVPLNAWTHIAFTYTGNVLTLYVNGVSRATASSVTWNNSSTTAFIGALRSGSYNYYYQGYLSNLRLTSSTVYTGNFTPPTLAPLATSGSASAASYPSTTNVNTSFASSACSLLTSMTNAGIYDNAMMNDLETVYNSQISTTQKKYGTGSLYFDGTGDWVSFNTSNNNFLGLSDFTVEAWIYLSDTSNRSFIYLNGESSGYAALYVKANAGQWVLWMSTSGSGWAVQQSSLGTASTGVWTHVAVVRNGTNVKMFINGSDVTGGGYTVSGSLMSSYSVNQIGTYNSGYNSMNGYIDGLRITKGVARYTSDFTVPSKAFPNK